MALIDRESPDVLVTDPRLPGTDGLAQARHARGHVPPIPVILITLFDSPQARSAAWQRGVGAYLAKPFSNAAFLAAVQRTLAPGLSGGAGLTTPRSSG
jgi:two-component system, NtrC family, nitrogen regulation response regulator GlnG